ncbi:MAG: alpha-glucosidase [Lachnospiraceae bacterium]|nr:alpha-glucosidase [Lachnospiraceae bacterium]
MKKWWNDKVAYQIYPKSFCDSNDDGIGDLKGIISKLDYLKDLGVDILWLSPIFCSPLADQGYDISDYYNIDERFGTMEDMDVLISEAKKRDMYILMDLVVNHCSDEHEWFKEAIKNPDGKYGKYFYIEDVKDGKLPNNLRAYFGGPVWDKLPGYDDKYYMHMFHKKQPDLNWENEEVREEVYKMVNWWLDKGLGGFRIDAIINIKKDLPFRDYEPDRDDGLASVQAMISNADGIGVFLKELRDNTFSKHDSFSVGEVFDVKEDEILDFIGEDGYFSSMFDFSTTRIGFSKDGWYKNRSITAKEYIQAILNSQAQIGNNGFLSNIIENHDEPRGVSHYIKEGELTLEGKKMLGLIQFMLRGIPFIYEGQEIGMENVMFESIDQIDDCNTLDEYEVARKAGLSDEEAFKAVLPYSRDNARTPMQWDDSENAGFTKGTPWIMLNPNYKEINVKSQINDDNSLFNFYKKLIALRKDEKYKDTIVYGSFNALDAKDENVMMFERINDEQKILVIANYSKEDKSILLPYDYSKILINNMDSLDKCDNDTVNLKGYQAVVLLK